MAVSSICNEYSWPKKWYPPPFFCSTRPERLDIQDLFHRVGFQDLGEVVVRMRHHRQSAEHWLLLKPSLTCAFDDTFRTLAPLLVRSLLALLGRFGLWYSDVGEALSYMILGTLWKHFWHCVSPIAPWKLSGRFDLGAKLVLSRKSTRQTTTFLCCWSYCDIWFKNWVS